MVRLNSTLRSTTRETCRKSAGFVCHVLFSTVNESVHAPCYAVLGFNIGGGWTTTPALDFSPAARRDPHEPQRANRGCGSSEPRWDEVHANSVCRGVKQRQQQRQIVGGHSALTRSWSDW